jgi:hypothetical protein
MIGGRAKRKYLRQVRPHIAKLSAHGTVIHGYSVAFGSRPGSPGAFLHIAETRIRQPRGKKLALPSSESTTAVQTVETSLVLASHRSNFTLMDAPYIVAWIDRIRGIAESPDDRASVEFFQIAYAGRSFLGCVNSLWPPGSSRLWLEELWDHPAWWLRFARREFPLQRDRNRFAGWFVMEEQACKRFLDALSGMIRGDSERIPELLESPRFDPVGFEVSEGAVVIRGPDSGYAYALFRDGLALLGTPPRRMAGHRTWRPSEGLGPRQLEFA